MIDIQTYFILYWLIYAKEVNLNEFSKCQIIKVQRRQLIRDNERQKHFLKNDNIPAS